MGFKTLLVPVDKIVVGRRVRSNVGDSSTLKVSMDTLGLLQPIGVDKSFNLVYGLRRLQAAKELGWQDIPTIICSYSELEAELAEHEENLERESLPWSLEVRSRARVVEIHKALGKLYPRGRPRKADTVSALSQKQIGKRFGITARSLRRDIQLARALDEDPQLEKLRSKKEALMVLKSRREAVGDSGKAPESIKVPLPDQKVTSSMSSSKRSWEVLFKSLTGMLPVASKEPSAAERIAKMDEEDLVASRMEEREEKSQQRKEEREEKSEMRKAEIELKRLEIEEKKAELELSRRRLAKSLMKEVTEDPASQVTNAPLTINDLEFAKGLDEMEPEKRNRILGYMQLARSKGAGSDVANSIMLMGMLDNQQNAKGKDSSEAFMTVLGNMITKMFDSQMNSQMKPADIIQMINQINQLNQPKSQDGKVTEKLTELGVDVVKYKLTNPPRQAEEVCSSCQGTAEPEGLVHLGERFPRGTEG